MLQKVQIREATFDDYDGIMRVETGQNLRLRSRPEWTALWVGNPLYEQLRRSWPIGWVLEDQDHGIVGTLGNVPVSYVLKGRKLVVAAGRAWAVEEQYRGIALMLMERYFSQENVDVYLNTTVNALAAEAFGVFGSCRVPAGDWQVASYWVTSYEGFAKAALQIKGYPRSGFFSYPAGACLYLKELATARRLPRPRSALRVCEMNRFDESFDHFWERLSARSPVFLGVRSRDVLDWHFGDSVRRGDSWILAVGGEDGLRSYGIVQRRDEPRSGLRRMRLVDFQALGDESACLLAILDRALSLARDAGVHVLEKVGRNVAGTTLFDTFAPYRRNLPTWPFYFYAPDPEVRIVLESGEFWRPSSFDGDASL